MNIEEHIGKFYNENRESKFLLSKEESFNTTLKFNSNILFTKKDLIAKHIDLNNILLTFNDLSSAIIISDNKFIIVSGGFKKICNSYPLDDFHKVGGFPKGMKKGFITFEGSNITSVGTSKNELFDLIEKFKDTLNSIEDITTLINQTAKKENPEEKAEKKTIAVQETADSNANSKTKADAQPEEESEKETITKEEAINKLKEAKELRELEVISKEKYDAMVLKYQPIILSEAGDDKQPTKVEEKAVEEKQPQVYKYSVINKEFTCVNCKAQDSLNSQGTSFKCPECATLNLVPIDCPGCEHIYGVEDGNAVECPKCHSKIIWSDSMDSSKDVKKVLSTEEIIAAANLEAAALRKKAQDDLQIQLAKNLESIKNNTNSPNYRKRRLYFAAMLLTVFLFIYYIFSSYSGSITEEKISNGTYYAKYEVGHDAGQSVVLGGSRKYGPIIEAIFEKCKDDPNIINADITLVITGDNGYGVTKTFDWCHLTFQNYIIVQIKRYANFSDMDNDNISGILKAAGLDQLKDYKGDLDKSAFN